MGDKKDDDFRTALSGSLMGFPATAVGIAFRGWGDRDRAFKEALARDIEHHQFRLRAANFGRGKKHVPFWELAVWLASGSLLVTRVEVADTLPYGDEARRKIVEAVRDAA